MAEEQSAEWAIFAALQPPQADPSNTRTHFQTSSTAALHTYPLHHIPSYIFPTPTSPSTSASPSQSHPISPSEKILSPAPTIPQHHQGEENTHNFVQQMLQPLVHNTDVALALGIFPDTISEMPQVDEEEEAKQPPPPLPPKEWTQNVYTFQDLQTQANLYN